MLGEKRAIFNEASLFLRYTLISLFLDPLLTVWIQAKNMSYLNAILLELLV